MKNLLSNSSELIPTSQLFKQTTSQSSKCLEHTLTGNNGLCYGGGQCNYKYVFSDKTD